MRETLRPTQTPKLFVTGMQNDLCGEPVVRLGLGTGRLASLGSGYSRKDAFHLLATAADHGVNLIDTADSYGSSDCETLLGKLLTHFSGRFLVATKAGYPFVKWPGPLGLLNQVGKKALRFAGYKKCFSQQYISDCIDGSLRRLKRESLDFFYLHDPYLETFEQDGWRSAVDAAMGAGKIRHFGISSSKPEIQTRAASDPLCEVVQLPAHIGIQELPIIQQPLVANHVFGRGLTSATVNSIAKDIGCSSRSLLLAYAAGRPGVRCVLTGTGRARHLLENIRALDLALDDNTKARLRHNAEARPF